MAKVINTNLHFLSIKLQGKPANSRQLDQSGISRQQSRKPNETEVHSFLVILPKS